MTPTSAPPPAVSGWRPGWLGSRRDRGYFEESLAELLEAAKRGAPATAPSSSSYS